MKKFTDLIADCLPKIQELFPWELSERLEQDTQPLLVDIREPYEFNALRIPDWMGQFIQDNGSQPLDVEAVFNLGAGMIVSVDRSTSERLRLHSNGR